MKAYTCFAFFWANYLLAERVITISKNNEPKLNTYMVSKEELDILLAQYGSKLDPVDQNKLAQKKFQMQRAKHFEQRFLKKTD
jgi:hypothetical protein